MTIALLLAAGNASRMGKPKMLLPYRNQSLLQHIIEEVKKCQVMEMVVVTGCYHDLLKDILHTQQVDHTENKNWEKGIGSSVAAGIEYIMKHYPDAGRVIIMVCDQPYLSSSLLVQLMEAQEQTGKNIIASTYNDTTGTPVLFTKKYFAELSRLEGQSGAKKLIVQYRDDTALVDFPGGSTDLDTKADYENFLHPFKN